MANKVGAGSFFVRIILVGFLLAILLVGALLSIFYHGTMNTFIMIALVVIPILGLLVMYGVRVYTIFHKEKSDKLDGEVVIPSLSEAKTIVVYGAEFADPYYKQLTLPHFEGKPSTQKNSRKKRSVTRNKSVSKSTYVDYTDKYNGVMQGQMSFDKWQDVLRAEPIVVETSNRKAVLDGKLTNDVLDKFRDEIDESAHNIEESTSSSSQKTPKKRRENIGTRKKREKKDASQFINKSNISDLQIVEPNTESDNTTILSGSGVTISTPTKVRAVSGKKVGLPQPQQKYKIRIHKKPQKDKRDDYVYVKQPRLDTNQPIKSLLFERFAHFNSTNTHSASQELLNKMRRDNIRR